MKMRDKMPITACNIDSYRHIYGNDAVNAAIKRGNAGEPVFYVQEGGHSVGTVPRPNYTVGFDEYGRSYIIPREEYPETHLFIILD